MAEIDWGARLKEVSEWVAKMDEAIARASLSRGEAVARELLGAHYIGPESYQEIFGVKDVGSVPPIPAGVTAELLNAECPLAKDGRKIKDTHRLVFIPTALDGKKFTLWTLGNRAPEAQKKCGRGDLLQIFDKRNGYQFANKSLSKGGWILMPMLLIPGTLGKAVWEQEKILRRQFPDYHLASVLEMAAGLVMNDLCVRPGRRMGDYSRHYGQCSDTISVYCDGYSGYSYEQNIIVGKFGDTWTYGRGDSPLFITNRKYREYGDDIGLAGLRNIE